MPDCICAREWFSSTKASTLVTTGADTTAAGADTGEAFGAAVGVARTGTAATAAEVAASRVSGTEQRRGKRRGMVPPGERAWWCLWTRLLGWWVRPGSGR